MTRDFPDIFRTTLAAVRSAADPAERVREAVRDLVTDGLGGRVRLVAFGKASVSMARAGAETLGSTGGVSLAGGVVMAVPGVETGGLPDAVRVMVGDHPTPTARSVAAALAVLAAVEAARAGEAVLFLVSGGGSAQLCVPPAGVDIGTMGELVRALLRSGATIDEINTVRRHADSIKGGRLALALTPGVRAEALVLSDVLGDPLHAVSSGPTAPDPTTAGDALAVLERLGLASSFPAVVRSIEANGEGVATDAWPVRHRVIGSNGIAVAAAAAHLREHGYSCATRERVTGEASEVGVELARTVRGLEPGGAVVWGGETTVRVGDAPGVGGRNQELALAAAVELDGVDGAGVMSFGTDGVDGPTDAAGAIVDAASAGLMRTAGVDAVRAIAEHDSHPALDAVGALVRTGPTGTNVNDVVVGLRAASGVRGE